MLDIYFTVDVEIWCGGWRNIDAKFPKAFERYVYGGSRRGGFGLPYQLKMLSDHGLRGVFFVEPLFAARFGTEPLAEIVGLIRQAGHEVQLHLHTEWVDEARTPLLKGGALTGKRQFLRQFTMEEQSQLIGIGHDLLRRAGGGDAIAFRAGSFGFNAHTLVAVARNGMPYDASYNASRFGRSSGVGSGTLLLDVAKIDSVVEVPMTVYRDGLGRLRHVQLNACSFDEIERLLWQAAEAGRQSFVMLSHNSELLSPSRRHADEVVIRRFRRLCGFLDRHRNGFRLRGFRDDAVRPALSRPRMLTTPLSHTLGRMKEQIARRGSVWKDVAHGVRNLWK